MKSIRNCYYGKDVLEIKERIVEHMDDSSINQLVSELWALRGKSNIDAAEKIAERSHIPFAGERLKRTRLLFLTKSDNVQNLLGLPHNGKSIISFSINTDKVYHDLEHRTASPEDRLIAAQQLQNASYEVRLRIDPVFIYEGWQEDYLDLVDTIFRSIKPSRFTIGEYRPSKGLVSHIKSRFPESSLIKINGLLINDGTKLRYPEMKRVAAFRTIIERIMQYDPEMKISLCKESPIIWKQLGMNMNGLYCNCLG